MTPVTRLLVLANVGAFALEGAWGFDAFADLALWPPGSFVVEGQRVGFAPWQLLTSGFLHAGLAHLFVNMFALYMFGPDVERVLGARAYLALYFAALLTASLTQLLVVAASAEAKPYPTVGASGAIFGVLLAFGTLFPRRRVILLLPPIPLPAWLFVTLYGLFELVNGVLGTEAGVAHFAHLGGMLGGGLVLLLARRRRAERDDALV